MRVASPDVAAPPDTIRVLYVDDPDSAGVAARSLEREDEGITVRTAGSADEWLEALAGGDVDCVVPALTCPGGTASRSSKPSARSTPADRIRENLDWAFVYDAVAIPLALLGALDGPGSLVQHPEPVVEVRGEGHPREVRHQQQRRPPVDAVERADRSRDEYPEDRDDE